MSRFDCGHRLDGCPFVQYIFSMQCSLFGAGPARFDGAFSGVRRWQLAGGAWIEHHPGWLDGHARVFEQLASQVAWQHMRRQMYEREVDVPRLLAQAPETGPIAELLQKLSQALSHRYGWPLGRVSLAHYRDGRDSVAFHGDKVGRLVNDCVIATVSVGAPRRFLLAPRHSIERTRAGSSALDTAALDTAALDTAALDTAALDTAALDTAALDTAARCTHPILEDGSRGSHAFDLGWGDLFVMGGSCQRTWQHAVPKRAHADPRISIMFRPPLEWSHGSRLQ